MEVIGEILKEYNFLNNLHNLNKNDSSSENQTFLIENNYPDFESLKNGDIFFKKQILRNSLKEKILEKFLLDGKQCDILLFCILENLDFPIYEKLQKLSEEYYQIIGFKQDNNLIELEKNGKNFFLETKTLEILENSIEENNLIKKEINFFKDKFNKILLNLGHLDKKDTLFPFISFLFLKFLYDLNN